MPMPPLPKGATPIDEMPPLPQGASEMGVIPEATPSMLQIIESGAKDLAKGVGESAVGLMSTGNEWARQHLPAFMTNTGMGFGPPANLEHVRELATPANTTQAAGKGLGDIAQFMIPGGAEKAGAAKLAELAPQLGKAAEPLARIFTGALSGAGVNAAQGGSPIAGAAAGGGGSAFSQGAEAVAPRLMEWAHGVHTPNAKTGKALLEETRSIFPGGVRNKARSVLDVLNPELTRVTESSPAMIPMQPARIVAGEQIGRAMSENNPRMTKGIKKMANQLMERDYEPTLGAEGPSATLPIPEEVPAREFLNLKRGIGKAQPKGSWNPESSNAFRGPRNAIYGKMADIFHQYVPEAAPIDRRISALIPATEAPKHTFGHVWGPGAGAMIGGFYGARPGIREGNIGQALAGGMGGALEGATAGFAAPTLANILARTGASQALPRVFMPAAEGTVLRATRKKEK